MARFNQRGTRPAVHSPVTTTGERTATHEGATGHVRDTRSEVFLLAVSNFVGADTFYEKGGDRGDRYTQLVRRLAVEDPAWCVDFLRWLRGDGNMRTASLVGAAEFVKARLDADKGADPAGWNRETTAEANANGGWNRRAIDAVLQRADEPGEMIGYWTSKYGRRLPKPVKRGIADAVQCLYNERSLLKYDTDSKGYRFGDVLNLVHASPDPAKPWQGDLFQYSLDRRHKRGTVPDPDSLPILARNMAFTEFAEQDPNILLNPDELNRAGLTWEAALSMAGSKVDKAKLWEALIPSMGYMALLRNLRNFDEAGVSDEIAAKVAAKLADPEQVARSRQLPMRFYSAFNAAPSLRWGHALEKALTASLANIPRLGGRTLILVDTSSSMNESFSRDGSLMRWDAAALFGIALGRSCKQADVVSFSSARYYMADRPGAKTKTFPLARGGSVLGDVKQWRDGGWFLGGGTDTAAALRKEFSGHDRVVIVTDEQAGHDATEVDQSVPRTTPLYTWNLAGYQAGHAPSGRGQRHTFGGLTDQAFRMVPLLEAGRDADWPWVSKVA